MKKNLLIIVLLLSACDLNADFEQTCKREEKSLGFINEEKVKMFFDQEKINKIVLTHTYKADNDGIASLKVAKTALDNYTKIYNQEGIIEKIIEDTNESYIKEYEIDLNKLNDEYLNTININRNYDKQITFYKGNMKCD